MAAHEPFASRSPARRVGVVVYSPANLNAIDGSSIWSQTVVLALAGVADVTVSILLSHKITTDRILGPLLEHPSVTVIDPFSERLTRSTEDALSLDEAARILGMMVRSDNDAVIVRGLAAAQRLAAEPSLHGHLLPYLTDIPQRVEDIQDETTDSINRIMSASPVLLCQTEELMTFMETNFSAVSGKGWLLPPVVPDNVKPLTKQPPTSDELRLCYSGKFASKWNTQEMCDLPAQLAESGITATLTMVGDKINRDPDRPEFVAEMQARLERSPGVNWVGGVSRARSIELMSEAHIGLSWRSPELDDSLELSTKLLEYCASGTPPILNRTRMHERVFGSDYPLYTNSQDEVIEALTGIATDASRYADALLMIAELSEDFTVRSASQRLTDLLSRLNGSPSSFESRGGRWARWPGRRRRP